MPKATILLDEAILLQIWNRFGDPIKSLTSWPVVGSERVIIPSSIDPWMRNWPVECASDPRVFWSGGNADRYVKDPGRNSLL